MSHESGRTQRGTHDGLNTGRMTHAPCLDIEKMSMYLYHDVSFHSKLVGNDTS